MTTPTPRVYWRSSPPFNYLGTFNTTQRLALQDWVAKAETNLTLIGKFHQVRAQQLRKSAGLLEDFNLKVDPRAMTPSFVKAAWEGDPDGHIAPTLRDDHMPANVMVKVKERFREVLAHDDESMFRMNWLRTRIEAEEDRAQLAYDAKDATTADFTQLSSMFADNAYQAVLVRDQDDQFQGEPRFRVHPLDLPTAWEKLMVSQTVLDT